MGARAIASRFALGILARKRRPGRRPLRAVGIFIPSRLGDFVLALGAIRAILEAEGADNCVLVISPYAEELARREFPGVARVNVNPWLETPGAAKRYLGVRLREDLFRRGVKKLVCLRHHRNFEANILFRSIPAAETWGAVNSELMQASERSGLPIHFRHPEASVESVLGEPRELLLHRRVLSSYFQRQITFQEVLPVLRSPPVLRDSYVAVSPFGSSAIRDFPRPQLKAAARILSEEFGLQIRLLVPPGNSDRYQTLAGELKNVGIKGVILHPCSNLEQLIEVLAGSRMTLSVETGTAHLASALDAPMVAILGGGHYGWFAPWSRSKRQEWLTHVVPCLNCNWVCGQTETICTTQISEDILLEAVRRVMSQDLATS